MPEMILNLSKVLEVLFPPDGAGRTLDAARRGLTALGFSRTEIEGDYIPAMALRNGNRRWTRGFVALHTGAIGTDSRIH